MKRILCLLVCLVLMLGLMPMAAGAASTTTVDEVSISGLDHPVSEQKLDTTYKLPTKGIKYAKDSDYSEVIWYDLGLSGNSKKTLKSNAEAEEGHYYMAELHLVTTDNAVFSTKRLDVEISPDMELRVTNIETEHENKDEKDTTVTVRLYYYADVYYDRYNPVELTVGNGDDLYINAGDVPWDATDFSGYTKSHFDITVTWYEGKQAVPRYEMGSRDRFEAGQNYTMKIELDAARSTKHAYFDPDVYIKINGERGESQMGDDPDYTAAALFHFKASEAVGEVVIKGIKEPRAGESRQRSGFVCSTDGVSVQYDRWEVVTSSGSSKSFSGDFETGKEYLLFLDLYSDDGYSLNLTKKDISVNVGTVYKVINDDVAEGICTVVIKIGRAHV